MRNRTRSVVAELVDVAACHLVTHRPLRVLLESRLLDEAALHFEGDLPSSEVALAAGRIAREVRAIAQVHPPIHVLEDRQPHARSVSLRVHPAVMYE